MDCEEIVKGVIDGKVPKDLLEGLTNREILLLMGHTSASQLLECLLQLPTFDKSDTSTVKYFCSYNSHKTIQGNDVYFTVKLARAKLHAMAAGNPFRR